MLSRRALMSILLLFATVFVLFMAFTLYSGFLLAGDQLNERALTEPLSLASGTLTRASLRIDATDGDAAQAADMPAAGVLSRRKALVLGQREDDAETQTLLEWCVYNKYAYLFASALPEPDMAARFDLLLFGSLSVTENDTQPLLAYAELGIPMIFTRLPDFDLLSRHAGLADFFGIEQAVDGAYAVDGAHLYADFFLSGDRLYTHDDFYGEADDMDITVAYYTLRMGYDVFMTAILDDQDALGIVDERMPALLWRTRTGNSQVFVVNCDLFGGKAMLGVVTAFASRVEDVCVYPIVNAQTVHVLNYPWMSVENREAIAAIYGHEPESLSSDIIWPGILQVLSGFTRQANFCVAAQYDFSAAPVYSDRLPVYYFKQVKKLLGTMTLSLQQTSQAGLNEVIETNRRFFERELPAYTFTSVYSGDFEPEELLPYVGRDDSLLRDVTMILSAARGDRDILGALEGDVLSVALMTNGFDFEARDDMAMISLQTALGLRGQYIDMTRTLFPETDEDYWNKQSITWSSGVTYYREFEAFDYVTAFELEDRARRFLAMDYSVTRLDDNVRVDVSDAGEGVYFIARLFGRRLTEVRGGTAEKLSDTAYLIFAAQDSVTLVTEPAHALNEP